MTQPNAEALLQFRNLTVGRAEDSIGPYDSADAVAQIRRVAPRLVGDPRFRRLETDARRHSEQYGQLKVPRVKNLKTQEMTSVSSGPELPLAGQRTSRTIRYRQHVERGVSFENLVGNLFRQLGLETKLTRSSRDGGVDVVAFDIRPVIGGKVVIQAKRYKNTVGVSAVRDLFGTMTHEGANKGILVTTSGYGPDAFEFSKDKPIELIDGGQLLYLLEQSGVKTRIVFPEETGAAG